MVGAEILLEIDTTLDRLICNAEAIQNINLNELSEIELAAFQKTQESLLHHLMHMDEFLETKRQNLRIQNIKSARYQIAEKMDRFTKLKTVYQKKITEANTHKSDILSKRRTKRLLCFKNSN